MLAPRLSPPGGARVELRARQRTASTIPHYVPKAFMSNYRGILQFQDDGMILEESSFSTTGMGRSIGPRHSLKSPVHIWWVHGNPEPTWDLVSVRSNVPEALATERKFSQR